MNNQEPLGRLADFYRSLDSVPTPPLRIEQTPVWANWTLLWAPLGAALLAYGFIALCAVGNPAAVPTPRPFSQIDRYAVDEIKALAPLKTVKGHASNRASLRKVV